MFDDELARSGAEVAVVEAGLGGRYDATNVIPSEVQVLTNVSLEHTRWLGPTITALSRGIDVALANKESLVIGGELVTELAEATGAKLLPVDSEHSAIQQLLAGEEPRAVDRIVLTASGGPFRGRKDLSGISVADALDHPTWAMGGRITIDSATLMNKGFEVIEARWLFNIPVERIEVLIHPQSYVHALVEMEDGSTLAQMAPPDMILPVQYALSWLSLIHI